MFGTDSLAAAISIRRKVSIEGRKLAGSAHIKKL